MIIRVAFRGLSVLKNSMSFYGRHISAFLFSVYFFLYVLSPVCCTEDGLSWNDTIAYQKNLNAKNIRVIWELILSRHLTHKDAEGRRPNVQLLIRKARALTNSNNIIKMTPSESAEFDYNGVTFSLNFFSSLDQHIKPEYRTGSYLSVSGLSPPYFS